MVIKVWLYRRRRSLPCLHIRHIADREIDPFFLSDRRQREQQDPGRSLLPPLLFSLQLQSLCRIASSSSSLLSSATRRQAARAGSVEPRFPAQARPQVSLCAMRVPSSAAVAGAVAASAPEVARRALPSFFLQARSAGSRLCGVVRAVCSPAAAKAARRQQARG